MTSRIRCSCGRVYDPQKHTHCPECGAESAVESVVVAEKVKPPAPVESVGETAAKERETPPPAGIVEVLKALPWPIWAGAAVLLLFILIFAFGQRGPKTEVASGERGSTAREEASPQPAATESPSYQGPSGGTTFPSGGATAIGNLGELIANTAAGGTLKLRPGLYQGGAIASRPIRIEGGTQGGGQVFIQSDAKDALSVRSKGVSLQNVQVMFTGMGEAPAISVSDNGELEMEGCKVSSSSSYGVLVNGGGSIKAVASSFTAANGTGVQADRQSKTTFTKCNFTDTQTGLSLANASTAELHACAFERNGARNGRGAILAITGDKTRATAEDCRFSSNPAGISVDEAASIGLTNNVFKDNGVSSAQGNWIVGLVQVRTAAKATFNGDTFETNAQGISATSGGIVEIDKCRFNGNGLQTQRGQMIVGCMAICANGQGTAVTVRNSSVAGGASYAVGVMWSARLNIEDTEISGARTVGLLVGDRNGLPATAEIKHCQFVRNAAGVGVCAGSNATITDSECRENTEGVIALDKGTRVMLTKTTLIGNREHGLYVYGGAEAEAAESQIENNARGALSGMQKKSSMNGSVTLQNCRVVGNQMFGVGASTKSRLSLTGVTFDGNGKTNIYKESGAIIQTDDSGPMEGSQASTNETPSSGEGESSSKPRRKQKVQRSSDDNARRELIRRFFRVRP